MLNQLFKKKPSEDSDFIIKLLGCYGLTGLDDRNEFCKLSLEHINTPEMLIAMREELREYYLPCKFEKFCGEITVSKAITILKQFLRIIDYRLGKVYRFRDKKKYIFYIIEKIMPLTPQLTIHHNDSEISFE